MSRRWPKRLCLVLAALITFIALRACSELMREPGIHNKSLLWWKFGCNKQYCHN